MAQAIINDTGVVYPLNGFPTRCFTVVLSAGDQAWSERMPGRIHFAEAVERGVALGAETRLLDWYTTPGLLSATLHTANATIDVKVTLEYGA